MSNKQIMIPEQLFYDLIKYHLLGVEDPEIKDNIVKELTVKIEAIKRRQIYTEYKTAPTEEERESARNQYISEVRIPKGFLY